MGWKLRHEARRYSPVFRLVCPRGIGMAVSLGASSLLLVRPPARAKALSNYSSLVVPRSLVIEYYASILRTPRARQWTEHFLRSRGLITDSWGF